jgi:hypothetical protein
MNKLAGIWNVWDGDELLKRSIELIKPHLDLVIVIYQNTSNSGEFYNPTLPHELIDVSDFYMPSLTQTGQWNETIKRNIGLQIAKIYKCTHFIQMDCDEMYFPEDFKKAKDFVYEIDLDASYCGLKTYYKYPTKQIVPDENYFVPFIHKIYPETKMCFDKNYPAFADPTRRTNTYEKHSELFFLKMHHYSFVRRDINRKLRNSSSSQAFENQYHIWESFESTGEMIHFKNYKTIDVDNYFNLEFIYK